jgi:hypothetical protein
MHMALVERENIRTSTDYAFDNADIPQDAKDCSDDGEHELTTKFPVVFYNYVESVRRPYPKGKPVYPNPFVVHKYRLSKGQCKYCYTPRKHAVRFGGERFALIASDLNATPQDLCSMYTNATENAIADVYAKANSPAIFDLAPELAELGETLFWLGNLFKGFKNLMTLILWNKGGEDLVRTAIHGILNPHELWLEYRYAFMPFYLTVNDAIKAYKGGSSKKTIGSLVKLEKEDRYLSSISYYDKYLHAYFPFNVMNTVRDTVRASASLTIKSQCDPSPFGLSAWDTLRAAYEVFPLSFVLNWFIGIEEWLASIRNTKLEVSWSYVTTVVNREGYITSESKGDINWVTPVDSPYTEFMMKRTPDIVPPVLPKLQAEHLSLLRSVDAIALIVGFLKGCLTRRK